MIKLEVNENILNEKYGVNLNGEQTEFAVWSPSANEIVLCLYKDAKTIRRKKVDMVSDADGIWRVKIDENLEGQFYTYLIDDKYEVIDPYVQSTNGNSVKGAILDAKKVMEDEFRNHKKPKAIKTIESIIYEAHIKDFTIGKNTPYANKGLYLAFTEKGLVYNNQKIGIDHLIELGITHLHIMPVYDFISVNDFDEKDYNWGYDPYLYNSIEGSYSSEPDNPYCRIIEFKKMIMALHEAGIRVVLDVVYNHTYFGESSNFHRLMPYVFHRFKNHEFTNGSGCGNEIDTENRFVRKFIMDSLKFWLETYEIDGFRFDLMGLYDVEFVLEMSKELHKIKPDILLYGEPWTAGGSGLEYEKQFLKGKQFESGVSFFNDDFRNNIKGSNDSRKAGFIGLGTYRKNDIYAGCFGSIRFNDEIIGFAQKPSETVNYVSSHDNLILMDKFTKSFSKASFEEVQNMNALALSFVILSLGIPFLQAGTEILRSKYGEHNSYKSGHNINRMHWAYKNSHRHVFDFVKILIAFRKSQKFYTIDDANVIRKMINIVISDEEVIHYNIKSPYKEDYQNVRIVYNGSFHEKIVNIDTDELYIDGAIYYKESIEVTNGEAKIPKLSLGVFVTREKQNLLNDNTEYRTL